MELLQQAKTGFDSKILKRIRMACRSSQQSIHIITSVAASMVVAVVSLVSCMTTNHSRENAFNLDEINVDPMKCIEITLRNDVPIRTDTIQEESIMPDTFLVVLKYREGGDEKEFNANLLPGYNNVSLVIELEKGTNIIHHGYCVVEMWSFYPERNTKLCYLCTLGIDSINMKVMQEDLSGRYLAERLIPLDANQIDQLKVSYEQLVETILKMLKDPLPYV